MIEFIRYCGAKVATLLKFSVIAVFGSLGFWHAGALPRPWSAFFALIFLGLLLEWVYQKWYTLVVRKEQ